MDSGDFSFLFIGDVGDNLDIFSIVEAAKKKGVEVNNYSFEGEVWTPMKAVSEIENTIFVKEHARGKSV